MLNKGFFNILNQLITSKIVLDLYRPTSEENFHHNQCEAKKQLTKNKPTKDN